MYEAAESEPSWSSCDSQDTFCCQTSWILKRKNYLFLSPLSSKLRACPRKSSVTQTSCDWVPCFLLQRCAETVQGAMRKGQISPQKSFKLGLCKLRTNCNCPNSPSVRSSQECWTQLPWHLKTQQGALSSFYLTFSHRAFQNTFENLLRQASYIYNIILTTATQRLSILHSLLGKKSPL